MNHRKLLTMIGAGFACAVQPAEAIAGTHSFEGSCAIVGHAELRDRMTPVPTQSWFSFRGEGRCMGTLDGKVMPERGVRVRMASEGPRAVHSCAVGYDPGTAWRITFDLAPPHHDVTIHGHSDILDVLRSQNAVLRGQRGGIGVAVNTIQGHGETLERCFSEGVTAGSVGIQLDTLTPLVSEDPPASRQPTGAAAVRDAPRLHLRLGYRRGRTRTDRRCARSRVRARVVGRDRRKVRRVLFARGRRVFRLDRRPPFRRTVHRPHRGRSHRHRVRARVRMKDGRVVRLKRGFRACTR